MNPTEYLIGALILLFLIICFTRALPFFFGKVMQDNQWILYLGKQLPTSIIFLLGIYYVIAMAKPTHWHVLPCQIIALVITLFVHWKWRNVTLSLFVGTTAYLLMTYLI
jgi:branched-subunit amino acid transport protein AzlD